MNNESKLVDLFETGLVQAGKAEPARLLSQPLIAKLQEVVSDLLSAVLRGYHWDTKQYFFASVAGLDLVGGVWANATPSTRRWWHRPGQGWRQHLTFAAGHIHPFLISKLYRKNDWFFAVGNYFYMLSATAVVVAAPLSLQRPLSLTLFAAGTLLNFYVWKPTAGLEWFGPVYLLKL